MVREGLAPLPSDEEFIAAVVALNAEAQATAERGRAAGRFWVPRKATAADVAYRLGIEPARRLGNGAVKGSWSGYMSPALRAAPRLRSLARQGRLVSWHENHRAVYAEANT